MKVAKRILFVVLILFFAGVIIVGGIVLNKVVKIASNLSLNKEALMEATTKIDMFDKYNDLINDETSKKALVKLEELPKYVPASFVSIEDKKFYTHHGLNYKRMVKAMFNNFVSGSMKEGASTISQQLIKNTHLSTEKTLDRKIKEILLVKQLEKVFSKQQILETYLNVIYFGNGSYGLESASHNFFNKSAKDLTLSESATLASIIKSPRTYSPIFNKENCLKRRNLVLNEMLKDKVIDEVQFQTAINEEIKLNTNSPQIKSRNFYEQAVLCEASEILHFNERELALSGYKIFTFFDPNVQKNLTDKLFDENYYHKNSFNNTADSVGVVLENSTAGVLAFNGKSDYDIVKMKRSPGSALKPIMVYAPALEAGKVSPITPILDEKTSFNNYSPHNVGDKYYGWISVRESIEKSLNIPAIKIMEYTGIENCKRMTEQAGVKLNKQDNNYAIALGGLTDGTSVLELVNTYIPFSQKGKFIKAGFVRKICDANGHLIYEKDTTGKQIMSQETAYLLTDMLTSSVKNGTSIKLNSLPYTIAGKTGTVGIKNSNNNSDVWSIAYTPDLTIGVWLGNSTNKLEFQLEGKNNGGTYCSAMLRDVFLNCNLKKLDFSVPEDIANVQLDVLELQNNHTVKLACENAPDIYKINALFNRKYLPKIKSDKFDKAEICKLNGELVENKPKLTFNALPYLEYKIFRVEEDKTKILKTIKNTSGQIEFLDEDVTDATLYTYYVESFVTNNNMVTNSVKSNAIKIFTPMPKLNIKNVTNQRVFVFE